MATSRWGQATTSIPLRLFVTATENRVQNHRIAGASVHGQADGPKIGIPDHATYMFIISDGHVSTMSGYGCRIFATQTDHLPGASVYSTPNGLKLGVHDHTIDVSILSAAHWSTVAHYGRRIFTTKMDDLNKFSTVQPNQLNVHHSILYIHVLQAFACV